MSLYCSREDGLRRTLGLGKGLTLLKTRNLGFQIRWVGVYTLPSVLTRLHCNWFYVSLQVFLIETYHSRTRQKYEIEGHKKVKRSYIYIYKKILVFYYSCNKKFLLKQRNWSHFV